MPRKHSISTTERMNTVDENNKTMTDTTISTTTVANDRTVIAEGTANGHRFALEQKGLSHRLVAYIRGDWKPEKDLSLTDMVQAHAGLRMIGKFVSGGITGNEKLIFVAPIDKLGYENATGAFAYVRNDYVPGIDAVTVDVGGYQVVCDVAAALVPSVRGFRRLYLDGDTLYAKSYEGVFTANGEIDTNTGAIKTRLNGITGKQESNTWLYWYARAASVMLAGNNVSISVGPKMLDEAKGIMTVVAADDKAAAFDTFRYEGRVDARFTKGVAENRNSINAEAHASGQPLTVAANDLVVPLSGGGTISLAAFTTTMPIYVRTAEGTSLRRPKYVASNSDAARLALAKEIRDGGYSVVLS